MPETIRTWSAWGATWANVALATDVAASVDQWLGNATKSAATAFDKAMDAEYLRTQIGGGLHRLFDGGHDLIGAWKAIRSVRADDHFAQEIRQYLPSLWKDVVTPAGLPIVSWTPDTYLAIRALLQEHLGVSAAWVNDMATFTATEIGGGVAGIAALLFNLRRTDAERFAALCASLGLSATVAANPIMVAIAIVALLKAAHDAQGRSWSSFAYGLAKGSAISGAMLGVGFLIGGVPGVVVGLPAAYLANRGIRSLREHLARRYASVTCQILANEIRIAARALPPPLRRRSENLVDLQPIR